MTNIDNKRQTPVMAVCSQKITLQEVYVTIMPESRGPKAGPNNVPRRNHPIAVARWTCRAVVLVI